MIQIQLGSWIFLYLLSFTYTEIQGNVLRTMEGGPIFEAQRAKYGLHTIQIGWHELVTELAATLPPQVKSR